MLAREKYIEYIKEQISIFQYKIGLETSLNQHNLKLYGENFFRDILNIINDGSNFENTNILQSNFQAIDLVCDTTKQCIQITSDRSRDKIKHTLEKFSQLSGYDDYELYIYYLLEKAKPNNITQLESDLNTSNLSSRLKDCNDLFIEIENVSPEKLEKLFKLFKIDETFINLFEDSIKSIKEEIALIHDVPVETLFNQSLNQISDYFKSNLDLLLEILKQIDCEMETNKKNRHEKYSSLYKFFTFLVFSKSYTKDFVFPTFEQIYTIVNSYKLWIFNSSKCDKNLDFHIGQIARYLSLNNHIKIDNGVCFITALIDNGGLSCTSCIDGHLVNVTQQVNKIITNFTNPSSQNTLEGHFDFMDLQEGHQIDFKCGQCISNIAQHANAKKII